jgi:hypothetical protein
MKVSELIEILEECDADADVWLMSQENYPFECRLAGVAVREEFTDVEEANESEDHERPSSHDRWATLDEKLPGSDVFLLEGGQVRYGSQAAWEARRR